MNHILGFLYKYLFSNNEMLIFKSFFLLCYKMQYVLITYYTIHTVYFVVEYFEFQKIF